MVLDARVASGRKGADENIAAGRVHTFDNVDDAIRFLHREAGDIEPE